MSEDLTNKQADRTQVDPEYRALALKERVYVTFTALAVSIPLGQHVESATVAASAATLALTVVGTLLATFLADLIAHVAVHSVLPSRSEVRRMTAVSASAFLVLVVPMLLLALAATHLTTLNWALQATSFVLVATLVVVTFIPLRRLNLPAWQKLVAYSAVTVLGLAVVALKLVVH
jgi:hypothetical protein